jgi:hypothetical protein
MKVSNYGISRFENEIKELKEEVRGLKQAECDCSVPLSQGQRRTVIGVIATVFLSFTAFSGYAIVSHEQQMKAEYASMNDYANYSQPMPVYHDAPERYNWVSCIDGYLSWFYSTADPTTNGMLKKSDIVDGPYTDEQMQSFRNIGTSNC